MLRELCDSDVIYMDGTFKTCQRLFYQLFIINVFVHEQQFSCDYGLLPSKAKLTYKRFFMLVKEATQSRGMDFNPSVHVVLIDFEIALIQSINM